MNKNYTVYLATDGYSGPNAYLTTTPDWTGLEVGHEHNGESMTLEQVGAVAAWAAKAWENLSGEEYKPVVISERGYVSDPGVITVPEPRKPKSSLFKGLRFPSQKGRDKA